MYTYIVITIIRNSQKHCNIKRYYLTDYKKNCNIYSEFL